jgi:hypothetical protein
VNPSRTPAPLGGAKGVRLSELGEVLGTDVCCQATDVSVSQDDERDRNETTDQQ